MNDGAKIHIFRFKLIKSVVNPRFITDFLYFAQINQDFLAHLRNYHVLCSR